MAPLELKSSQFRRERQATWQQLERLVDRIDRSGAAGLSPRDLSRLPILYRSTLSSLSVAQAVSLDRNLLDYLEALSVRAYLCVYSSRANPLEVVSRFFGQRLPAEVRAIRWFLLASFAVLGLGAVSGLLLTQADPDYFYAFVSDGLAQGRSPAASTATLREALYPEETATEALWAFASFLFTHNAAVGLLAFGLGIAFGVPTVLLLFTNGLMIGAFSALYIDRGMGVEFFAWLLIHGVTELLAIALFGAAGLLLAKTVVFPGRHSRLANLAIEGRRAAIVVCGGVALLFCAALLEGLGRQLILDTDWRFAIALGSAVAWLAYFGLAGRSPAGGGDD